MPLIEPPKDEPEALPEIDLIEQGEIPYSEHIRIKRFLDIPNWMCLVCSAVNFGRNKHCAYCFGRRRTVTPRPSTYVEPSL
jgi:hypothetical protein